MLRHCSSWILWNRVLNAVLYFRLVAEIILFSKHWSVDLLMEIYICSVSKVKVMLKFRLVCLIFWAIKIPGWNSDELRIHRDRNVLARTNFGLWTDMLTCISRLLSVSSRPARLILILRWAIRFLVWSYLSDLSVHFIDHDSFVHVQLFPTFKNLNLFYLFGILGRHFITPYDANFTYLSIM